MDDENKDLSTSQDTQEENADDQQQNDSEGEQDELALLKAENEKLKKAKSDQEQRAKIAEDKLKKSTPNSQVQPKKDELTNMDLLALIRGNVHDDDMETVKRFAKLENISLADALKNDELKAVLKVRDEKRKTSEATSTGKSPRGSIQVSDEVILERAAKGTIPEAGSKEAEALFWARHGGKR